METKCINTTTYAYPITEGEVRHMFPHISFPRPFVPPDPFAVVEPTTPPTYEPITHKVVEKAPALDNGVWRQVWQLQSLPQGQVDANKSFAIRDLVEAATTKRWEIMTGGITLPDNTQVGTTIDDQNRITSVVANATLAGLTDGDEVDFKSVSGWVRITVGEVKQIAGVVGRFVQACYSAERAHFTAITELETVEAIRTYDVEVGWPEPTVPDS